MGGIGVTLGYRPLDSCRPVDGGSLLREVWDGIKTQLWHRLRSRDAKSLVSGYMAMEAEDGLHEGRWFAGQRELMFTFGDAAGLCVREMYVTKHFVEMAIWDASPALQARANALGAELTPAPPRVRATDGPNGQQGASVDGDARVRPDLRLALADGQLRVGFTARKLLVSVAADEAADLDTPIRLIEEEITVGDLPPKLREEVLLNIRRGRCVCELCESIRAARGLPPGKAPKSPAPSASRPRRPKATAAPAPAPRWSVFDAPVQVGPSLQAVRADPAAMVVVDLDQANVPRKPAAVLKALSGCPLRALSLRSHGMTSLWPEVRQLHELEVLSLLRCELRRPLGDALLAFPKLRAIHIGSWRHEVVQGVQLPPDVEILDGMASNAWNEPAVLGAEKLRSADIYTVGPIPEALYGRPIDTLKLGWDCEVDPASASGWPLRFLDTSRLTPFRPPSVEFLALADTALTTIPDYVQAFPRLRALHVNGILTELPEWLAELPQLEMLFVRLRGVHERPGAFRVLSRMERLRVLALQLNDGPALPLDLSACSALEVLALQEFRARTAEVLPRGVPTLPKLRTVIVGHGFDQDLWKGEVNVQLAGAFYGGVGVDYYRMTQPRQTYDHVISRWGVTHYTDLLCPA